MSEVQEYTVEIGISFANDSVLSVGDVVTLDDIPPEAQSDIHWLLQQNYLVPVVPVHEVDLAAAEVRVDSGTDGEPSGTGTDEDPPATDLATDPPSDPPADPPANTDLTAGL